MSVVIEGRKSNRRHTFAELTQLPHYVYHCFGTGGQLLYIGCTHRPDQRLTWHRGDKARWVDLVAYTRFTVWPDRRKALDMERLAIETELPLFNKTHNRRTA